MLADGSSWKGTSSAEALEPPSWGKAFPWDGGETEEGVGCPMTPRWSVAARYRFRDCCSEELEGRG